MHSSTNEEVAGQRAGGRMVHHLVDLQLVVARSRLEEEVVGEVLNEIARGEDVIPVPGAPL